MNRQSDRHRTPLATVEARFAARLAASLNERAEALPHDISERLRAGRERALERAVLAVPALQSADAVVAVTPGGRGAAAGAALLGSGRGGFGSWWLRVATWVPLAVLIAGLVLIQERNANEQVQAAAEIDAVLLADDLPPQAWADPGFREFLKAPPP